MRLRSRLIFGTLCLAAGAPLLAQDASRLVSRQIAAYDAAAPGVLEPRTITYGPYRMQALDYWSPSTPKTAKRPPLIVFVHGGAWSMGSKASGTGRWKEAHFPAKGFAFASLDYRLVPTVQVEDQADDIAHALRTLITRADELGFDPHRIVLMGHSAGAHLVALVSTDPAYVSRAGLAMTDIAGTIAVDGAGYDVPQQIATSQAFLYREYVQAFGTDPARQRALSPVFHASAPNVGRFLILHTARADSSQQSDELATILRRAGSSVQVNGFAGTGLAAHLAINRRMGDPAYPATSVVDQWLANLFAPGGR